jgi:hypothetical protein
MIQLPGNRKAKSSQIVAYGKTGLGSMSCKVARSQGVNTVSRKRESGIFAGFTAAKKCVAGASQGRILSNLETNGRSQGVMISLWSFFVALAL